MTAPSNLVSQLTELTWKRDPLPDAAAIEHDDAKVRWRRMPMECLHVETNIAWYTLRIV